MANKASQKSAKVAARRARAKAAKPRKRVGKPQSREETKAATEELGSQQGGEHTRQHPELLRRLLRAKDRMDAASHEQWPIRRLARVSCVSEAHFARAFKQAFGNTHPNETSSEHLVVTPHGEEERKMCGTRPESSKGAGRIQPHPPTPIAEPLGVPRVC